MLDIVFIIKVLEVVYSIVDIVICYLYLKCFLEEKNHKYKFANIAYIIGLGLMDYITTRTLEMQVASEIVVIIISVGLSIVCFRGHPSTKIINSVMCVIILSGSLSAVTMIVSVLSGISIKDIIDMSSTYNAIISFLIGSSIRNILVVILIFKKRLIRLFGIEDIGSYKYVVTGILTFACLGVNTIRERGLYESDPQSLKFLTFMLVIFCIYNMVIILLIVKLVHSFQEKATNSIILNAKQHLEQHILELEQTHQEIKKAKHDMLNHYNILEYLLVQQKYKECYNYLGELKSNIEKAPTYYRTGNDIIDAVINQKIDANRQNHICFQVEASISSDLYIAPIDLGAILSNLLDNAIEAVQEIEDDTNRMITLKIHNHHKQILIDISNTVVSNPIKDGTLIRRKKDCYKDHGYGMKSIQYVVDKYNGYMTYKYEDGIFYNSILFCN